jgi:hypothetical protein
MSPKKEPHFFSYEEPTSVRTQWGRQASRSTSTLAEYQALFSGIQNELAWGEASPSYLYAEEAPVRIHQLIPSVRMVAILRDPVERALSNFVHAARDGRETIHNFEEAIAAEDERIRQGWGRLFHYMHKGFYYQQLSRYLQIFDPSQLRIFLFEDLKTDPQGMVATVLDFLEVDTAFRPNVTERHNVSGMPRDDLFGRVYGVLRRSPLLVSLAKKSIPYSVRNYARSSAAETPQLPPDIRRRLVEVFRDDTLRLQELIGRDLTAWLK